MDRDGLVFNGRISLGDSCDDPISDVMRHLEGRFMGDDPPTERAAGSQSVAAHPAAEVRVQGRRHPVVATHELHASIPDSHSPAEVIGDRRLTERREANDLRIVELRACCPLGPSLVQLLRRSSGEKLLEDQQLLQLAASSGMKLAPALADPIDLFRG